LAYPEKNTIQVQTREFFLPHHHDEGEKKFGRLTPDFFPQVTAIRLPVGKHPLHVELKRVNKMCLLLTNKTKLRDPLFTLEVAECMSFIYVAMK
jgi:hypothetical protein